MPNSRLVPRAEPEESTRRLYGFGKLRGLAKARDDACRLAERPSRGSDARVLYAGAR